jgi:hypothetical protein
LKQTAFRRSSCRTVWQGHFIDQLWQTDSKIESASAETGKFMTVEQAKIQRSPLVVERLRLPEKKKN